MAKKVSVEESHEHRESGEARQARQIRLLLRRRQGRRRSHDEGPARRQGLRPRGDDQREAARAGRLHDLDARLHHLLQGRRQDSRVDREGNDRQPAEAREVGRPQAGRHEEAAARVGALGREVLDARHDGHDPEPRPQRRDRRIAEAGDRQRPVRRRQLSPLHSDVRQRRPRDSEGRVRARARCREEIARRESRHRPRRSRRCAK